MAEETGRKRRSRRPGGSVKAQVLGLLDEEDREWSGAEVRDEFIRRGNPLHDLTATDPSSPIRTALLHGIKEGRVIREGRARYKSAKYDTSPAPRPIVLLPYQQEARSG